MLTGTPRVLLDPVSKQTEAQQIWHEKLAKMQETVNLHYA